MGQQRWDVRSSTDFGRAIADIRHRRCLTQAQLAERSGHGRSQIAKIEAGKTTLYVELLLRLLRRLGASVTITIDDAGGADGPA